MEIIEFANRFINLTAIVDKAGASILSSHQDDLISDVNVRSQSSGGSLLGSKHAIPYNFC